VKRLVVLVLLAGCALPVKVGEVDDASTTGNTTIAPATETDNDTPGVVTSSSSSETGDDPPPAVRHDYAIRFGDLPELDSTGNTSMGSGGSGDEGTSGGDPFDPDALLVTATLGLDTCEDPYGSLPCGDLWNVSFNLPPDLQFVGATGRLEDINGNFFETGPMRPEGDCSGGGGSLLGTFEITEIDATHVAGRLRELELAPFTELDFDAPRC
jgi:hypothetical protein